MALAKRFAYAQPVGLAVTIPAPIPSIESPIPNETSRIVEARKMKPIPRKTRNIINAIAIAALVVAFTLQHYGHAMLALWIEMIVLATFLGSIFLPKDQSSKQL
jgi:hypothetical protein